ncbi:MAG: L-seryl-tRNA(Sec) selenium transferase [Polyangiaceae bacterium]|nr:L-seryl-tRNA(Sec) selenium transferase [Polyangiaceae bacterium]
MKAPAPPEPELSALPRVDQVLQQASICALSASWGEPWLKQQVRHVIDELRGALLRGERVEVGLERVVTLVERRVAAGPRLRPVINATGVVLHTGLGRAPLGTAVREEIARQTDYCDLELDLASGKRNKRGELLGRSLAAWLGAEACHFTSNNAGAVLLCLAEIARGRDVLVSRGELIEIGGGFRIPEMLEVSGARLVEVGTTNRTRLADYERALNDNTACILRVHPSNFRAEGFVARPLLSELSALAQRAGVPLIKDLGGGRVSELGELSRHEPSVQQCLDAGADAVCFSLDKLFGGPQGGAIVGREALIGRFRAHPLARVLRVGKLTLGALGPVIRAHVTGASSEVEVSRMILLSSAALKQRAERWLEALDDCPLALSIEPTSGAVGGGTLPGVELDSWALVVRGVKPHQLAEVLRSGDPAVLARVQHEALWIDARTPGIEQDASLLEAFRLAATRLSRATSQS